MRFRFTVALLLGLAFTSPLWMPTVANASPPGTVKVGVCHATESDTNPYEWIIVASPSTTLEGHLEHRNNPNKNWKSDGTWNGIDHKAGDPKRDYIEGLDQITIVQCEGVIPTTAPPTTAPPTTEPPTTEPPVTTEPPTTIPETTGAPVVTTEIQDSPVSATNGPGELPATGGQLFALALAAATLIGLGLLAQATRFVRRH
jgi:hypothetical protein